MTATAKRDRAADRATVANDLLFDDLLDALKQAAEVAGELADPHHGGCACRLCRWRSEQPLGDVRAAGGTARILLEHLGTYLR